MGCRWAAQSALWALGSAREMAREIDLLWSNLEALVTDPAQIARYASPPVALFVQHE